MKKMSFIVKFIVAFIVATFAVALCIRYDASDNVVIVTYFGVSIMTMLALGAFDVKEKQSKYNSIKHRMSSRNYGQAAIFIGTACLYMGTPQQCDELCDDLWHHGQQAHVQVLDGNETFDIL